MQIDVCCGFQRLEKIGLSTFFQRGDCGIKHLSVEVKTDTGHRAGLMFAQDFAGAPNLQVMHGQIESAAEFFHFLNGLKTLLSVFGHGSLARCQQIGISLMVRTSDATA